MYDLYDEKVFWGIFVSFNFIFKHDYTFQFTIKYCYQLKRFFNYIFTIKTKLTHVEIKSSRTKVLLLQKFRDETVASDHKAKWLPYLFYGSLRINSFWIIISRKDVTRHLLEKKYRSTQIQFGSDHLCMVKVLGHVKAPWKRLEYSIYYYLIKNKVHKILFYFVFKYLTFKSSHFRNKVWSNNDEWHASH